MEYVLTGYNFSTALVSAAASLVLFVIMGSIYEWRVTRRRESHPGDFREYKEKLAKQMNRQFAFICVIFALMGVGAMVNDVPNRFEEIKREVALVELTKNVEAVTEHRLDELCAFNGFAVDINWIETDIFPCVTIGEIRIWTKGATRISRDNVVARRAFVIGIIKGNQSISRRAEIDFEATEYGIRHNYPRTSTEMSSSEIAALAKALDPK